MIRTGILPSERLADHHWKTSEDRLIRSLYPAGGTAACLPHMPRRAKQSIRQRAHLLGIRRSFAA